MGAGAVALALTGVLLTRPTASAPNVSRQQVHLWNHTLEPSLSPGSDAVADVLARRPLDCLCDYRRKAEEGAGGG